MNNPWRTFGRDVSMSELEYMRSQHMTNKQIAEKFNVSPSTIGRYLGPARKRRTKMVDEDYKLIIKLYKEDGYSPKYIAEDVYGCAVGTIYRILRENGFEFSRGRKKTDIPEKVEEPEEVIVEPSPIAVEEPKSACLAVRDVKIYSGNMGEYLIDFTSNTIELRNTYKEMNKQELGFYIRDLMAVWKEMRT